MDRQSVRIVQVSWTMEVDRFAVDEVDAEDSVSWKARCDPRDYANRQPSVVLHVFGSVADGRKACVNVRGFQPYLHIPALRFFYEMKSRDELCAALGSLAEKIDRELNRRATSNAANTNRPGGINYQRRHVSKIELVLARPFYGYYDEEAPFFRIDFFNPIDVRRTASLFQNGVMVPNQNCPVYSAHLPYEMQFLIDHTLFGMNWLHFSTASSQYGRERERFSVCEVEYDIEASQILNVADAQRSKNVSGLPGTFVKSEIVEEESSSGDVEGTEFKFELTGVGVYDEAVVSQFNDFKADLHKLIETINILRATQTRTQTQSQSQSQSQTAVATAATAAAASASTSPPESSLLVATLPLQSAPADVHSEAAVSAVASQRSVSTTLDFSFNEKDFLNSTMRVDQPQQLIGCSQGFDTHTLSTASVERTLSQEKKSNEIDNTLVRAECEQPVSSSNAQASAAPQVGADANVDIDADADADLDAEWEALSDDDVLFVLNASRQQARRESDSDSAPDSEADAVAEELNAKSAVNRSTRNSQQLAYARLSSQPVVTHANAAATSIPTSRSNTNERDRVGSSNATNNRLADIEDLVSLPAGPSSGRTSQTAVSTKASMRRGESGAEPEVCDLAGDSDSVCSSAASGRARNPDSFSSPSSVEPELDEYEYLNFDSDPGADADDEATRRRIRGQFDGNDDSSVSSSSASRPFGQNRSHPKPAAGVAGASHKRYAMGRFAASSSSGGESIDSLGEDDMEGDERPRAAPSRPFRSVFSEQDTRFHNLSWMQYVRELEEDKQQCAGDEDTAAKRRRTDAILNDDGTDEVIDISPLAAPPKLSVTPTSTAPIGTLRFKTVSKRPKCVVSQSQSQSQTQSQPNAQESDDTDEDEDDASLHVSLNLGCSAHGASENRRASRSGNNLTAINLELFAELRYLDPPDSTLPPLFARARERESEMDILHWLRWQPETDSIRAACYNVFSDLRESASRGDCGVILVNDFSDASESEFRRRMNDTFERPLYQLTLVANERELIDKVVELVHRHDPDLLIGYDIERGSWGYFLERARFLQRRAQSQSQLRPGGHLETDSPETIHITQRLGRRRIRERKQRSKYTAFERDPLDRLEVTDELSGCSNRALVHGRMLLNLWRIVRGLREEQPVGKLRSFTVECVVEKLFNQRLPSFGRLRLTQLWRTVTHSPTCPVLLHQTADDVQCVCQTEKLVNWRMLDYLIAYVRVRTEATVRICVKLRLFQRTSEFARLYGIQFAEALTRGSQFRVESVMLRIARRFNLLAFSASRDDLHKQAPPIAIPLTLEPQSAYYREPVCVLDFQSLYPSVMIAYNYCYSTVIGRITHLHSRVRELLALLTEDRSDADQRVGLPPISLLTTIELGCRRSHVVDLAALHSYIFGSGFPVSASSSLKTRNGRRQLVLTPSGVLFYPAAVRKGVLPILLESLLNTRVIVKDRMQRAKAAGRRERAALFNIRQLALKLLANVVFGYTAASFTGRSSCVDISDSVVSAGRMVLERTIDLIDELGACGVPPALLSYVPDEAERAELTALCSGCRVVYGDTDSCFVELRGRTVAQALRAGRMLATFVSRLHADRPPMRLKFERVYSRCILETKKRYFGFAVESESEIGTTILDAKGIETIRTDQCGLVQELLESAIHTLFDTDSLTVLREHLRHQFGDLLASCAAACRRVRGVADAVQRDRMRAERFVFWREFHGVESYIRRLDAPVPSVEVIRKRVRALLRLFGGRPTPSREMLTKLARRVAPLRKEKVPYLIVSRNAASSRRLGEEPRMRLVSYTFEPLEALHFGLTPDVRYYLDRQVVPSLNRFILLVDAMQTTTPHTIGSSILQADCAIWLSELESRAQLPNDADGEANTWAPTDTAMNSLASHNDADQQFETTVPKYFVNCARQRFESARMQLLTNVCQSCMQLPRTCAMLPIYVGDDVRDSMEINTQRSHLACQAVECPVFYRYYLRF